MVNSILRGLQCENFIKMHRPIRVNENITICRNVYFFSATDAANVQMRYRSSAGAAKLDGVVVK